MHTAPTDIPVDGRLRTAEVAPLVRMHPKTLERAVRAGRIKGVAKLGRCYLWPRSVVRELLGLAPDAADLARGAALETIGA